jgi:membrane-bound ClpP family serine protease
MYAALRLPPARTLAALAALLLTAAPLLAQNNEEGLFVSVPSPLNSDAVTRIKNQISARRNTEGRAVRKIIFDFTPEGKPAFAADFGPCSDLATTIRELTGATTVAFVHGKVTGHAVLPALTCKELVMSPDASLGEVAAEGVRPLDEPQKAAYSYYFRQFHPEPLFPVVEKMYDRQVQLYRAVKPDDRTTVYYDKRKEAEVRKAFGQLAGPQKVEFAQDDQLGIFDAKQARQLGLSNRTLEKGTRQEVAEVYGLAAASLRDDVLGGRPPEAFQYTLKGDVDSSMRSAVGRVVKEVKRKKGNMLFLTLNCTGTDLVTARELADDLIKAQQGDDAILIVGFIPEDAPDAATFVALGCSDIVMSTGKEPGDGQQAGLGNFEETLKAGKSEAYQTSLRQLAEQQGYPGILVDGMFDKNLVILRVRGENDTTQRKLMSDTQFEQANRDFEAAMKNGNPQGLVRWEQQEVIKPKGKLLKLDAAHAAEYGLARFTVDTRDVHKVYALYGVDPAKVREATPGWLDRFAEFIQMPVVTVLLVVIGFTGLILELKVPGLTVPGIVAALCFILVFWAHSRFSGEVFVLALLLFILGLVLIGMEIFVLPGFGAPGVIGILLMLGGLALVTFEKVPQSAEEWGGLGLKVSQYLFAGMGSFVLAFLIARFLPKVPYANRLMLAPPEQLASGESLLPGASEAASLLGAIGTASTPLRPAGVVRVADKFVDVVSDGGFVPSGARVQVIAVEGTRVVVKEV